MAAFRQTGERLVHRGKVVSFHEATFVGPDGDPFDRDIVRHPGAVSIVPLLDDGNVVMVRQYRAALARELLEIPAGKLDVEGEPPLDCARRELAEEVGYRAERLDLLVTIAQTPGFCDELNHIYLGRDLSVVPSQAHGVEETHMTIEHVPLREVPSLIAAGELIDAKSIVGLMLSLDRLASEHS
ncbi:MAG TPA: NUDIX hydrolase [Microthrixaceae bacterium]|nr:NUDIX hydrolase [Microthrixaceae bacterium]